MADGVTPGRLDLMPITPFDPLSDPTSIGQRWKTWKRRFEVYVTALNVTNDKQKRAVLLYQVGQATQEILDTLPDTGDDFDTAMTKLDSYFSPKKNVDYEILKFRTTVQNAGETIDQYATKLRKLASNCEFSDLQRELKSTIIQNCTSKRLRRIALRDDLSLDALLAKARSMEISERQAHGIEKFSEPESANLSKIQAQKPDRKRYVQRSPQLRPPQLRPTQSRPTQSQSTQCRYCGYDWPHKNGLCPAKDQTCNKCGKPDHFAQVCHSKPPSSFRQGYQQQPKSHIHQVAAEQEPEPSDSDDEYLYTLGLEKKPKTPMTSVLVNNVPVRMMIDTGASTNIMDEPTFSEITNSQLQPPTKRIFAYGANTQLAVIGQFTADISVGEKLVQSTIHVLKGNHGSLLSWKTACKLGLVDLKVNEIHSHSCISDKLIEQNPNLFRGIGKLKDVSVKLHIDDTITPVAQATRRIPFHLRQQVSKELDSLEQQGIIEKVDGPTPWVSPLVIMANQAIRRERHPTPTIDDLIHNLNGATVFSKLDLKAGYHQIALDSESRYITTFSTHKGLRRYARLNFGTNSASEVFQNIIGELIRDIPGSTNISDDIIVYGKTQADHDEALKAVFRKFAEKNLTLNVSKCEFNKPSLSFFGFIFSKDGISPDPQKVSSIHNMSPPTTVHAVRSFLGMATYCAKFIPSFSDISLPLRELTKKNVPFRWNQEQQELFELIKQMLTSDTIMAYFDPCKDTELITDASPVGLSAILSQRSPGQNDRKIVVYVSRSLSDVERRYSQTEKEALAIVWAIEKLHLYLYGKEFTLYTDCKPVQLIFNNSKSKPPARIERWNLRLQGYNFRVVHAKGSQNPSDFLSRHTSLIEPKREEKMAEQYVNFLSSHAVPRAMTLTELQAETKADGTLQKLVQIIRTGDWNNIQSLSEDVDKNLIKQFANVKEELTVNAESNLILRGSRIVIPTTLQQKAVEIAHEGHQGIVKTKKLLREKVWFPGIEEKVKVAIQNCIACQANGPANHPQPLKMSPLPPKPWHTVNVDFCGPFPTGEYLLVVIDAYSRFPEVEIVNSTHGKGTISKLDRIFATHGFPKILKSDNGPPFFGEEFKKYMQESGICHQKITLHPYGLKLMERQKTL